MFSGCDRVALQAAKRRTDVSLVAYDLPPNVARVSNLLYRWLPSPQIAEPFRIVVLTTVRRLEIGDTAGWKPALRDEG
jgi:hypothetical protein